MTRVPGDGKRYQTRRAVEIVVSEPNWNFLEGVIGALDEDARAEIRLANDLYAFVGPQHDPRKTLLLSDITSLLRDWIDASDRLRSGIAANDTREQTDKEGYNDARTLSRADVVAHFYGSSTVRRIGKMLPLEFLNLVATAAVDAAAVVTKELADSPTTIKIELWKTWVALIADTLRTRGLRVSASLRTKTSNQLSSEIVPDHYSPFLRVVLHLQQMLPDDCRRVVSDDTLVKDSQETFRNSSHLKREDLIAVLAGYGAGLLGTLPNGLRGLEPDQEKRIRLMLGTTSPPDQSDF